MSNRMMTLGELFKQEEAKRLDAFKTEQAKEDAAWNALSDEERDAILEARERAWDDMDARLIEYANEDDETEDYADDME